MIRFTVLFFIFCLPIFGLTGLDVMALVQEESRKRSTREAVVDMIILDSKGRERARYFNYWTKFKKNSEKSLIKFFRPTNVKGTSLLTHSSSAEGEKSQWIYLPAFKSVKQLSSSDKNKSFMGSDFSYSDIAGRKLNQDNHRLIKETPDNYYIESIPNDLDAAIYSKIRYIISKELNIVKKAIFYDKEGNKLKSLTSINVSKINGVNVVMGSEMVNHQTDGKTMLTVVSMKVGYSIKDDFFSVKGLKAL
ncbi:MAG: outer membrane lipoprotein-sorting protein [Candidatus Margulisiibacteriota bacterium]|nr:outer membrane lipoprotein-sorting protein [Candidatus Margulisiibacteriota bacterium]